MVDHHCIGIFHLADQLGFLGGVAGHHIGNFAEQTVLGGQIIENEIGDYNTEAARHGRVS
jgi:hypothetical protein